MVVRRSCLGPRGSSCTPPLWTRPAVTYHIIIGHRHWSNINRKVQQSWEGDWLTHQGSVNAIQLFHAPTLKNMFTHSIMYRYLASLLTHYKYLKAILPRNTCQTQAGAQRPPSAVRLLATMLSRCGPAPRLARWRPGSAPRRRRWPAACARHQCARSWRRGTAHPARQHSHRHRAAQGAVRC